MKLTDLNRAEEIGSNSWLAEVGPFRFIVDAGLHPKKTGLEAMPDYSKVEENSVDFIILTHCHLDHVGSLPVIMRQQPDADVFVSQPSLSLAPRMLRNSCNVMRRQRDELKIAEYPLYTFDEVNELDERLTPLRYHQPELFYYEDEEEEQIEITLFPAGHVAGAAAVRIVYKGRSIFFSGDVLFTDQRTLPGAKFPEEKLDTVILETTRGLTQRSPDKNRASEMKRLIENIRETLEDGGSVLLPVFALGRMQEILAVLHDAQVNKELPYCPVYCTGLGMDLVDYFDAIHRKTGLVNFSRKILKKMQVKQLKRNLNPGEDMKSKGIYILSSGMLVQHTPSYLVAACLIEHPKNKFCFVGYCDPDTPGGKLLATEQGEKFLFDTLDYHATVRAQVLKFDLSGHADREELVQFALDAQPRQIVLTHGDPEARQWFLQEFAEKAPEIKVLNPEPGVAHDV